MKPPPFDYVVPSTLGEAVSILKQHDGEAKVLAGGQSLVPLLAMRLARPSVLVDLARVPGLDYLREEGGVLAIGAMARQRAVELSDLVARRNPLLHHAARYIAHPQIRNRGTVGGSIAHGDPAAVFPAVSVVMDAEFRVEGPSGSRTVGAAEFFVSYLTTTLEAAEVLSEARFPFLPPGTGWSFMEIARRHGDFALAGVAATVSLDGDGRCVSPRVVLYGVGPTPVRATEAERMVGGQRPSESLFASAGETTRDAIGEPLSDVHGSAAYRRQLAGTLTRRALEEAVSRAERHAS